MDEFTRIMSKQDARFHDQRPAALSQSESRPRLRMDANGNPIKGAAKVKMTRGDRMIAFCETLKVPDGKDVGKAVVLRQWQRDIIKGIYDRVDQDNKLLIREAVLTMGRKNSKTTMAAMLCLGHLIGPEATKNGQIYSAGFDTSQAMLVYECMENIIDQDPELILYTRRNRTLKTIRCVLFNTKYKALSSEARSKHGFNPVFVIFDELAQFESDTDLYDALKTSTGAQDESLLLVISTQAGNDTAILSQLIDYGRNIKDGIVDDPSFELFEFSAPNDADIFDPEIWKLANPALGDFRSYEELARFAERARHSPSAERTMRQLYLNQRVTSAVSFISPSTWKANGGPINKDALLGKDCIIGIDLSSRGDLTAMVATFPIEIGGVFSHFEVLCEFFCPDADLKDRSKRERVPYFDWVGLGLVNTSPGSSISYAQVARKLLEYHRLYNVVGVAYDRWKIDVFKKEIDNLGSDYDSDSINWIEHGQGFKDMDPAVSSVEDAVLEKKIKHGDHPVLAYCIAMTVIKKDEAGNRKFDKIRSRGCIDGTISLAMGVSCYKRKSIKLGNNESVYESRGILSINMG